MLALDREVRIFRFFTGEYNEKGEVNSNFPQDLNVGDVPIIQDSTHCEHWAFDRITEVYPDKPIQVPVVKRIILHGEII